jgi:murein DD-endopeptidase MepM/ murein hydrolase activator NlpD
LVGAAGLVPALPAHAAAQPPFELTFPQETSETYFSNTFGAGRSGGRRHHGIDLMASRMVEVYAVAPGTVIHVGTNRLSGRNVRIQHEDGWTSHYVHLNNDTPGTDDGDASWALTVAPGVEEGMQVEAGQLIAWVGDSGNAEWTAPHTHFELRDNGQVINPYSLLVDAFDRDREHEERLATHLAEGVPDYGTE